MRSLNALTVSHDYLKKHIKSGYNCIDATAGRGRDTLFLAELVGMTGSVISFDVQQEAINSTRELLEENNLQQRVKLVLDSHSNMGDYAQANTIDAITFNLGWLPGGDHSIFTKSDTSIEAIKSGLSLLRQGGIITICIYYGRDCGFEERDLLLQFLPTLDHKKYSVLVSNFANYPNNPPIPVLIRKENL